jgi:hypothetical protein
MADTTKNTGMAVEDDEDDEDHDRELVSILSDVASLDSPRRFDVSEKMFASAVVLARFK